MERRLAAILVADVVGYPKQMEVADAPHGTGVIGRRVRRSSLALWQSAHTRHRS